MARLKMARNCLAVITLATFLETVQVYATGVFELDLLAFKNDEGVLADNTCCNGTKTSGVCSGTCSTYFRICLKHFEREITYGSECTYGEHTTTALGNNSFLFPRERGDFANPLQFTFSFAWRGDFSLILEAYDETARAGTSGLIYRLATQGSASPAEGWLPNTAEEKGIEISYRARVTCDDNYYGAGCNDHCVPRDEIDGHWTCSENGSRLCLPGWTGPYCGHPICLEGCHPENGYCSKPNECSCRMGYQGKLCTQCVPYPGCDKGYCRDKPFECICQDGWGGLFCNQDLNYCTHHAPCRNSGTCTNTGQGSYTCTCAPGFTGSDCETEVSRDVMEAWAKTHCLNGGTYFMSQDGRPGCECPRGFDGARCNTPATRCDQSPCANGATCEPIGNSFRCNCAPGWMGVNCQQNRDECASSPCQNGGKCVDKVNGFECVCLAGFNGSRCETNRDECADSPCQNSGTCIDKHNAFECDCAAGYIGQLCEVDVDECALRPCANGGSCQDLINDFSCSCPPGYAGRFCTEQINECASTPCINGGVCSDLFNDYICACPLPWEGKNCQYPKGQSARRVSTTAALSPEPHRETPLPPAAAAVFHGSAGELSAKTQPLSSQDTVVQFTKEQLILVVGLGSGIPLVLLTVVVALLVYRRCQGRCRRRCDHSNNGSSDEEGQKTYAADCTNEKNQNLVNSMNNRLAHDHKMAGATAVDSKYASVRLSNELDETDANHLKPFSGKVTNKDLLKSFNVTTQKNVDYLTVYIMDEQQMQSDHPNVESQCSIKSETRPATVSVTQPMLQDRHNYQRTSDCATSSAAFISPPLPSSLDV